MVDTKILVVDDDPEFVEMLTLCLGKQGFGVLVACDGRQALDLARRRQPDLILLDVLLPQIDGLQVCQLLRAESCVPIIMVSGCTTDADKLAGLNMGADDYVTKPLRLNELLARIRAVLRRTLGVNAAFSSARTPRRPLMSLQASRHVV